VVIGAQKWFTREFGEGAWRGDIDRWREAQPEAEVRPRRQHDGSSGMKEGMMPGVIEDRFLSAQLVLQLA
jgi:hypothetical protein